MPMLKFLENCETHKDVCKELTSRGLIYKNIKDLGLYIVKYNKNKADMEEEDIMKCRGLVCEMETNKIVGVPPFKSKSLESVLENEKFSNFKCEEFIDGTMINLFYYKGEKYDGWLISTRSTIGANCRWTSEKTFSELFNEAKNFDYEPFDKDYTYTFVLQHPDNRIVQKIQEPRLVLVEVTNNTTLITHDDLLKTTKETLLKQGIKINIPNEYAFSSLEEVSNFIEKSEYQIQGVILKNKMNNKVRTKVRNSKYNFVKMLLGNSNDYLTTYIDLRKSGYLNDYLHYYPEQKDKFKRFSSIMHEITVNTYKYYLECFVKKSIKHNQLPFIYRPLVYELHGEYLKSKTITDFPKVKQFIHNLPTRRTVFLFTNKDKTYDIVEAEQKRWDNGYRCFVTCNSCNETIFTETGGETVECKCGEVKLDQSSTYTRIICIDDSKYTFKYDKIKKD